MLLAYIHAPTTKFPSSRLLLASISLFTLLLTGCAGKVVMPSPSATSGASKTTASTTPTSPQVAVIVRDASASPSRTITPPPSSTSIASSSATPPLTPSSATVGQVHLNRLAWSPDGRLLAAGSGTGIYLYDTSTWQEIRFIPLRVNAQTLEGGPKDLTFSFDGTLLGTSGDRIEVWRVANGSLAYELKGQRGLAASPTEGLWATFNVSAGQGGRLQLWRTNDGGLVRELPTGRQYGILRGLFFSPDGQLIASTAADAEGFVVSRVSDGKVVGKPPEDSQWWDLGYDLSFHPGDSTMAVVGSDDLLALWDARNGSIIRQLSGPNDATRNPVVEWVRFSPDGSLLATSHSAGPGGQGGTLQLWQAAGTRIRSWQLATRLSDFVFSPDSKLLAVAEGDTLSLLDPSNGGVARRIKPVWHQGILPTPTPTPLTAGLKPPADWKEYLNDVAKPYGKSFRLTYPPAWSVTISQEDDVWFRVASSSLEPLTAMQVNVHTVCGPIPDPKNPGSPANVEAIKQSYHSSPPRILIDFVEGGKWPTLVPATYGEFDITHNLEEKGAPSVLAHRKFRMILLNWAHPDGRCVSATLEDELADISEEDRLDFSSVLASLEFEDPQHPFPTITPTVTPTPNRAPAPAQPLQIGFNAKTAHEGSRATAEAILEIRDAQGNPVTGALVTVNGYKVSSTDNRYKVSYNLPEPPTDQEIVVEVRWNSNLIAKQQFVLSWK
jgi:WD40 repeat protein